VITDAGIVAWSVSTVSTLINGVRSFFSGIPTATPAPPASAS
jgi:hypothetical protein